ncbi:hypothetical protein GGR52DRAFT_216473 [Hypoxylon sp. FL1284]|nr:hypothetical protein GGR52DRAFT_216473 [Hypoxylon sp. FL1284]
MQALPSIQVSDLPSSASFYSAITQPLKLRYISANSSCIVFGDTTYSSEPEPVFQVRSVRPGYSPSPSRLVLSAHSPSVVSAFRAAALRADPCLNIIRDGPDRVAIADADGNRIEAACSSYSDNPMSPRSYAGSTAVASDAGGAVVTRNAYTSIQRSFTTPEIPTAAPQRASSRGFGDAVASASASASAGGGGGGGFGTLLGAAAVGVAVGGALTYTFMSRDRQRAPRQEYDSPRSTFYRRASAPGPDARSRVETIYDSDEYAVAPPTKKYYPPMSQSGRYSQYDAGRRSSRALEDVDDRARRSGGSGRSRRSSDAGTSRRPLMIADAEYRSSASSRHGSTPKLLLDHEYHSQAGSRYTTIPSRRGDDDDGRRRHHHSSRLSSRDRTPRPAEEATYVSARSKRSGSTARQAQMAMPLPPERLEPGRSSRRHHHNHHHGRGSQRDLDGRSRDSWENWDSGDDEGDDLASVAPSDSISCAGDENHHHGRRRRSSRNPLPSGPGSVVGRYRKVVNEFDEKHRPLYGSEYY